MTHIEYRAGRELRAADEAEKRLQGFAAVFNAETDFGWFREQIAPGAFSRSLKETPDVRALVDHDAGKVIARTKAGTLTLEERKEGLFASIDVADTSAGRDILESVRRGDIDGMSFGFRVVGEKWEAKKGKSELRTLTDVDLVEVSVVAFPAYAQTSVWTRSAESVWQKRAAPIELYERRLNMIMNFT